MTPQEAQGGVEECLADMERAGGDRLLNLGTPTRYGYETEARHVLEAAGVPDLLREKAALEAQLEEAAKAGGETSKTGGRTMPDDLRFRSRVVRPEPSEPYVALPYVTGGYTAGDAIHDTAMLFPEDGRYEDVMMRVFGPKGVIEVRFSSQTMREALDTLPEVRRA